MLRADELNLAALGRSLQRPRRRRGLARTPGGQAGKTDTSVFSRSSDRISSGQGNQVGSGSGGDSLAWHGGAEHWPGIARVRSPLHQQRLLCPRRRPVNADMVSSADYADGQPGAGRDVMRANYCGAYYGQVTT